MSRIGKQPVNIPDKVTVSVKDNVVVVKGPKGELSKPFPKEIGVVADAKVVNVTDLTEVKGAAGKLIELEDVFRGLLPYIIVCLIMLVLICVFPQMALYLPQTMRQ